MTNCSHAADARPRFPTRAAKAGTTRTGQRTPDRLVAIGNVVERLRTTFVAWRRHRADGAEFADITDDMLRDIGTTRAALARAHLSFFMKL